MQGLKNTRTGDVYFGHERADVLSMLPPGVGKVLDVGCGAGGNTGWLRGHGAETVHGIEIMPEYAAKAEQVMDRVWTGTVEQHLASVEAPYDAALCLDVLEHLVDPASVLRELHGKLRPGGTLLVSLPNARHIGLVRDLLLRGTFGYTDIGHRDWTHLRWFTRRDAVSAIEAAGFTVEQVSAPHSTSRLRAAIRRIRIVGELTNIQWYYRATAR